jgi:hypothetical protein
LFVEAEIERTGGVAPSVCEIADHPRLKIGVLRER